MQDVGLEAQKQELWRIRIRSFRDICIQVRPKDSIGQVKQSVLKGLQKCDESSPAVHGSHHHYVRLVCRGRLLAPDSAPLNTCGVLIQPNDVIHAVLTKTPPVKRGVQAALQQGSTQHLSHQAMRSAGINAQGVAVRRTATGDQEEDDDSSSFHPEIGGRRRSVLQRRGFDRLRISLGLQQGEINALRSYFSRHVDRFVQEDDSNRPEERESSRHLLDEEHATQTSSSSDPLMRRRLQEEAWMQSQGPQSEFRLNLPTRIPAATTMLSERSHTDDEAEQQTEREEVRLLQVAADSAADEAARNTETFAAVNFGTNSEFVIGFLLGFFIGFVMVVWMWMPSVSHKQKLGIMTGITLQLSMTMMQPPTMPPSSSSRDHAAAVVVDEENGGGGPAAIASSSSWRSSGYAYLLDTTTTNTTRGGDGALLPLDDDQVILG